MRGSTSLRLLGAMALVGSLLLAVPAAAADVGVEVQDFQFAPEQTFVNVGDTVTWTWVGAAPHDVTPVDPEAFDASDLVVEGTFAVTFDTEGEVPYFCTLHASPDGSEGMIGTVTVLAEGEPLPEPAPTPRPAPDPQVLPSADDAVGTSLVWSALFADGSAPTVVLGRNDVFADSLTSGALQGLADAPLLLNPTDELDDRVVDELTRLGATTVVIMGGEAAISPAVEQALRDLGLTVERIQGITRIETANALAETYFTDAGEAFLVRAYGGDEETQAFADSLSVGGAAARAAVPILLSETDRLSATTATYLQASSIRTVHVVGGTAAVSDQVVVDLEALGIEVERLDGENRVETSIAVVEAFYGNPTVLILIEGQTPDAWVAGFTAASAAESAPILLATGPDLAPGLIEGFSFGISPICGPGLDPTACDRAQIASSSLQFGQPGVLLAPMSGDEEVPGPGAEPGRGDFLLKPTRADDALCYEISIYGLGEPLTGAHIHAGAAGEAGDVVVPLNPPTDGFFTSSCTFDLDPELVADIQANPGDYYANYHTKTFPAGAVRGQLFEAQTIGFAELSGADEVPPVEVDGGGFFALVTDARDHTRLAYYLNYGLADGTQAVAAHIHEGAEDENGPVVQALELPTVGNNPGEQEGTFLLEGVDEMLVEDLIANTGDYYVNLHTEAFPDGALRGQLFNPFAGPPPS